MAHIPPDKIQTWFDPKRYWSDSRGQSSNYDRAADRKNYPHVGDLCLFATEPPTGTRARLVSKYALAYLELSENLRSPDDAISKITGRQYPDATLRSIFDALIWLY